MPQSVVDNYFDSFSSSPNIVIIGDVFWPTGQRICETCKKRGIKTFFLQHGQWIYIKNKKSLAYYPSHTLLFGTNVSDTCVDWDYAKHSLIHIVGSPRYDPITIKHNNGHYIYFSPPVIEEIVHNRPSGRLRLPFLECIKSLKGIDDITPIVIQPHYREARIDLLQNIFPKAQFVDPMLDPFPFIQYARKVIASRNSTIVLDAIAHRKITVLTDFRKHDDCFFKRGYFGKFALESDDRDHFIRNLQSNVKLEHGTGYVERAKKYIYLGNASERVVGIIRHGD